MPFSITFPPYDYNETPEEIYQAAKNGDHAKIKALLAEGISINVRYPKKVENAVSRLASEGNFHGVEILMEYGAHPSWAGMGAAKGGAFPAAEYFRIFYGANVSEIGLGAAWGGFHDYAKYLLENCGAKANSIAFGAAIGGYYEFAKSLLNDASVKPNNIIIQIMAGAACRGDFDYAMSLFNKKHANINIPTSKAAIEDLNIIASFAALHGYCEFVEDLTSKFPLSANRIARGAANGGCHTYAEYLLKHSRANIGYIIVGAIHGKYRRYAEHLRIKYKVDTFYLAEHVGNHLDHDYAQYLCEYHQARIALIAKGALNNRLLHYQNTALRELTLIHDNTYRIKFANALEASMQLPANCKNILKLAIKAEKIRAFQDKYHLTYKQALSWSDIDVRNVLLYTVALMEAATLRVKQGIQLRPALTSFIFFRIITFISPYLNDWDVQSLYNFRNDLVNEKHKTCLKKQLIAYGKRWFFRSIFTIKAEQILQKLENTNPGKEVQQLLEKEKEFFQNSNIFKQNNNTLSLSGIIQKFHKP